MIEPVFQKTLLQIHDRLAETAVLWVVIGSLGMALQGVPMSANDIDLQTDAASAYKIERIFPNHITRPVTFSATDKIRSHFGALELNGIRVEIIGDLEKQTANGRWQPPPPLKELRRFISLENRLIPVLDLVYEQAAYEKLGRIKMAVYLQNWLQHNPK